jgi:hypothetical protein
MTAQRPQEIVYDAAALGADLDSVEALARARLAARRAGFALRLDGVSSELADLLAFTGLAGVLGLGGEREPEEREERRGVEEERHLGDAPL